MQSYYTSAHTILNQLSSMDAESLRPFLPEPIHPFVLLSYPIRSGQASGLGSIHVNGTNEIGVGGIVAAVRTAYGKALTGSVSAPSPSTSHCSRSSISSSSTLPSSSSLFYAKGPNDILFVIFWSIAFTVLREALMRLAYRPFASWYLAKLDKKGWEKDALATTGESSSLAGSKMNGRVNGAEESRGNELSRKEKRVRERVVVRFAEQAWTFSYYTVFWSLGFYILSQVPMNPFSSQYLWQAYPHTPLSPLTKFYYLAQLGFWFHQLVIFNLEARRKDYWQMLAHHFITIALVVGSYWANYTRVGSVILVLMDFCDIWLPLAKLFRYLRISLLTDITFVIFLLSWLITRQIGFSLVTLSCIFRAPKMLPWEWAPQKGIYVNTWVVGGFPALLVVLVVMNCIWFGMACNVAWRVVMGLGAEDTRSDDEGDLPETDAETTDGVRGDLISSKGTDEVHPHRKRRTESIDLKTKTIDSKHPIEKNEKR